MPTVMKQINTNWSQLYGCICAMAMSVSNHSRSFSTMVCRSPPKISSHLECLVMVCPSLAQGRLPSSIRPFIMRLVLPCSWYLLISSCSSLFSCWPTMVSVSITALLAGDSLRGSFVALFCYSLGKLDSRLDLKAMASLFLWSTRICLILASTDSLSLLRDRLLMGGCLAGLLSQAFSWTVLFWVSSLSFQFFYSRSLLFLVGARVGEHQQVSRFSLFMLTQRPASLQQANMSFFYLVTYSIPPNTYSVVLQAAMVQPRLGDGLLRASTLVQMLLSRSSQQKSFRTPLSESPPNTYSLFQMISAAQLALAQMRPVGVISSQPLSLKVKAETRLVKFIVFLSMPPNTSILSPHSPAKCPSTSPPLVYSMTHSHLPSGVSQNSPPSPKYPLPPNTHILLSWTTMLWYLRGPGPRQTSDHLNGFSVSGRVQRSSWMREQGSVPPQTNSRLSRTAALWAVRAGGGLPSITDSAHLGSVAGIQIITMQFDHMPLPLHFFLMKAQSSVVLLASVRQALPAARWSSLLATSDRFSQLYNSAEIKRQKGYLKRDWRRRTMSLLLNLWQSRMSSRVHWWSASPFQVSQCLNAFTIFLTMFFPWSRLFQRVFGLLLNWQQSVISTAMFPRKTTFRQVRVLVSTSTCQSIAQGATLGSTRQVEVRATSALGRSRRHYSMYYQELSQPFLLSHSFH